MIGITSKPYTPIKRDLIPQNKEKQKAFNSGQNKVNPNFGSVKGNKFNYVVKKTFNNLKNTFSKIKDTIVYDCKDMLNTFKSNGKKT